MHKHKLWEGGPHNKREGKSIRGRRREGSSIPNGAGNGRNSIANIFCSRKSTKKLEPLRKRWEPEAKYTGSGKIRTCPRPPLPSKVGPRDHKYYSTSTHSGKYYLHL